MNKFILLIKKIDSQIWLLLALSILAWGPLLTPAYFFQAHDARHSIFYLVEFDQTLRDGYFWPRWSPDFAFGYGYPLFNIYAPLAIYGAEIFHLLGFEMVWAVKIMYILATVGAGLAMYGFVRRLFGPNGALLAGMAYMFAPFHLVEIYVRSAYAEYVSLVFLPLILWAFTELIAKPTFRRLALAGTAYGLLALTHHTTFFTFTPFLMLYILVLLIGKARLNPACWLKLGLACAGAGLLGVALAGIYLIPALLEQRYIKVEQWTSGSYDFAQHFVYFSQLLSPFWGYGYAGPGPIDFMPYQIGIVIYALLAFAIIGLLWFGRDMPHKGTALIFIIASGLTVWLMSPLGGAVWQILPLSALIQFPFRLLIVVIVSLAVVAGSLAPLFKLDSLIVTLAVLIIALGSYTYAQPEYTPVPDWADTPLAVINWDSASIADRVGMVVYTEEQPTTSPMESQYRAGTGLDVATIIAGEGTLETIRHGGSSDAVRVTGDGVTVQFYTYDYPGWRVELDGVPLPHRHQAPYGLITVDVPPGEHTLSLKMGSTPARIIGGALSLLALIVIVIGIWSPQKK